MYQSAAVMKYLSQSYPEVNMLIAALAKRSDLEIVTGTYSQAILSLNPPKDRSMQIERMTTLIRRYYGIKASSCFFYGQIWAPFFIHSLRNTGISSVVISAYRATTREKVATSSFVMNELGKRVDMRIISDEGAQLFSRYAQSEITLDELESGLMNVMDTSDDDVVFFSIDQMLEGSARQGDDERISDVLIRIISHRRGCLLSDIPCGRPGYLDSGWYGRDAYAQGLYSFNDIFVRNENFRYLLNRYIALSETVSQFKKDRNAKREAEAALFHVSIGPLFIHDAQCTPMRQAERRSFWKAIIEAEESLLDSDSQALKSEYDYEEIGMNDYAARGKMFNAEPAYTAFRLRSDNSLPMQSVPLYSIEGTAGLVPLFTDQASNKPVNYIHIPNLPKCDGAIYIVGDSMYPLLKSGDIVLYKQLQNIDDIFWGDMYLLSIDLDGEEYITVKYIQRSDREGYVKLVSQNPHHADKEIEVNRIRAIALVKASIRMNSIR